MPASITTGVAAPLHDDLVFLDEAPLAPPMRQPAAPAAGWRVLIVDDDADVHSTTTFALAGLEVQDRPLEFLHAYSAGAARELLEREPDIAVILLDVVMEQPDAGLHLVRHIRETLGMGDVRIILRTGQPGYTPEMEAIRDLDINDYRTKSELTRTKLYTTVAAAVRSYQQLHALRHRPRRPGTHRPRRHGTDAPARRARRRALDPATGRRPARPGRRRACCARANRRPDALRVLGAAGDALPLEGQLLDPQLDARLHGAAARALAERRPEFSPTCMALYFPGKSGRDFALRDPARHAVSEGSVAPAARLRQRRLGGPGQCRTGRAPEPGGLLRPARPAWPTAPGWSKNSTRAMAPPVRGDATLTLVDLDHFAETNDALGHQFGDRCWSPWPSACSASSIRG